MQLLRKTESLGALVTSRIGHGELQSETILCWLGKRLILAAISNASHNAFLQFPHDSKSLIHVRSKQDSRGGVNVLAGNNANTRYGKCSFDAWRPGYHCWQGTARTPLTMRPKASHVGITQLHNTRHSCGRTTVPPLVGTST
eukprot:3044561-Amphidinium_carterae.2